MLQSAGFEQGLRHCLLIAVPLLQVRLLTEFVIYNLVGHDLAIGKSYCANGRGAKDWYLWWGKAGSSIQPATVSKTRVQSLVASHASGWR